MSQSNADPNLSVSTTKWLAAAREDLLWTDLDGEFVVFHRPSAKTHFVNRATWLLLEQVLGEPSDAASAATALAGKQGSPDSDGFCLEVYALLMRLEELGLVERV